MKHITIRYFVEIADPAPLFRRLTSRNIYKTQSKTDKDIYSFPIEVSETPWRIHLNTRTGEIDCYGDASSTRFRSPIWASRESAWIQQELDDLLVVYFAELFEGLDGVNFEPGFTMISAQLVRHYRFADPAQRDVAVEEINVALYPAGEKKLMEALIERNYPLAGMRAFLPCKRFFAYPDFPNQETVPKGISASRWDHLQAFCSDHLCLTLTLDKAELYELGLDGNEGWDGLEDLDQMVADRFKPYDPNNRMAEAQLVKYLPYELSGYYVLGGRW